MSEYSFPLSITVSFHSSYVFVSQLIFSSLIIFRIFRYICNILVSFSLFLKMFYTIFKGYFPFSVITEYWLYSQCLYYALEYSCLPLPTPALLLPAEKERSTHLNAEFQRKARRDKKAFLSDQCENQRKAIQWEKLDISSRKLEIPRELFMQRRAQ